MSISEELRDKFLACREVVFKTLIPYVKQPKIGLVPLEKKLRIVSDFPDDVKLSSLIDKLDPLSSFFCIVQGGDITGPVQFGTDKRWKRIRFHLDIYSHDPKLREQMGEDFESFFEKNYTVLRDPAGSWFVEDSLTSDGNLSGYYTGCYRRKYQFWVMRPAGI